MAAKTVKRLTPLLNRVLIKRQEAPSHSKGGVVLPETKKSEVKKGTVVAVGPGTVNTEGRKVPCCLKVGDAVLLPDYGGTKVKYGDSHEYFLYREYDILAKITE